MRLQMYESTTVTSFLEAVEKNKHFTFELNGDYDSGINNELMDTVRALIFKSQINSPMVILEDDNGNIINVFHEFTYVPF